MPLANSRLRRESDAETITLVGPGREIAESVFAHHRGGRGMSDEVFESPFVCWTPARAAETMLVDAVSPHDSVFFATHQPMRAFRRAIGEETGGESVEEQQVFEDLRLAAQPLVIMPITGEAGTGKSHLVRWMYRRMQAFAAQDAMPRRLVYIPKSDTNLRQVIRLILEGLEGEAFERLRTGVDTAVDRLDESQAGKWLVSNVALRVEGDTGSPDEPDPDIRAHLRANLRPLLVDPWFERRFVAEGGVVDRLVREALEGRRSEDKDEPFEFRAGDFDLTIADIQKANQKARELYRLMHSDEDVRRVAAELLNEQLQPAIHQLFGVSERQLFDVMLQARRELLGRGVELVLFIEDFAILQGIQRDLLDAITEAPTRDGVSVLCPIRVVMAVTTGYFRRLGLQTVATRAGFAGSEYNLDLSLEGEGGLSRSDLERFVGRYLNASRVGQQELEAAFERAGRDDPDTRHGCPTHARTARTTNPATPDLVPAKTTLACTRSTDLRFASSSTPRPAGVSIRARSWAACCCTRCSNTPRTWTSCASRPTTTSPASSRGAMASYMRWTHR